MRQKILSDPNIQMFNLKLENKELRLSFDEIIKYCEPHLDLMWAASIVGILLKCDFRDAKTELEKYTNVKT